MKACAGMAASSALNGSTNATSSPSFSNSTSFRVNGVNRNCCSWGWKNSRGCGSNTMAAEGTRLARLCALASAIKRAMTAMDAVKIADGYG